MPELRDETMPAPCLPVVGAVSAPWRRAGRRTSAVDGAVRRALVGIVIARLGVNGGIRVVYPFLAVIAGGLGVSFGVVALLVASRSLAGLAGPAIARATARRPRHAMVLSLALVAAGCAVIALSTSAPPAGRAVMVGAGFAATGLARPLFELPMQTWVSEHVPRSARGRALGVSELGWALSLAVTVPVAGVLIERIGWRSPFLLVALLAVCGAVVLRTTVPEDGPPSRVRTTAARASVASVRPTPVASPRPTPIASRRAMPVPSPRPSPVVRRRRLTTGWAVCAGAALAVAAGEAVLVVYGQWLSNVFGLSVARIGMSTLLIVAAELMGEGLVVAVADRVGLCRTLFSAIALSLLGYAVLGLVGGRVGTAYTVISAVFVAFEVTVVALIALASVTAAHIDDRRTLLGRLMCAVACGNALGAAVAPVWYAAGGIGLVGKAAAAMAMLALAVLWLGSGPVDDG